jgi:ubiquinone/menaquinone biosynthesis C-methylase UbiE
LPAALAIGPAIGLALLALLVLLGLGVAGWWLLHVTEGAYLGPRFVAWLYDLTARRYDHIKDLRQTEEAIDLGVPLIERLIDRGADGPDALVLDVATGTGRLPLALLRLSLFSGTVVGVDLAPRMLAIAAEKLAAAGLADRAPLLHHAATPLPFADASFDAVCLLEALEFLPDADLAIAELYRVLRPGGTVLLTQRIDWQARLMPGHAESRGAFRNRLEGHGFEAIMQQRWTTLYDIVWAVRPSRTGSERALRSSSAAMDVPRWAHGLRCSRCGADNVDAGTAEVESERVDKARGVSKRAEGETADRASDGTSPDPTTSAEPDSLACATCGHAWRLRDGVWRVERT